MNASEKDAAHILQEKAMHGLFYNYEAMQGRRAIVLGYKSPNDQTRDLLIKVVPELGNNLYCYRVGKHDVVHYDNQFALTSYYTGNPILYPFPNRVENCRYGFEGKRYWQIKNGIPIYMHSLVYDENWGYREPVLDEGGVSLETYIKVDETHPIYKGYPFKHTITVTYRITPDAFQIFHKVENEDEKNLPFGISYHTFFAKLSGDEGTKITVPAQYMMELTDALLPTGKLLDVEGRDFDLRTPVSVGKLDLDNCFTGMAPGKSVIVDYTTIGLKILMDSTEDYTHMQVFTPKGKPFICVEKQTSSTDAPNLDAKGFKDEAHLLVVKPGGCHSGRVDFTSHTY